MVVLNILFLIVVLGALLWQASLLIAIIAGAPTVYAKNQVIIKAFKGVGLQKGQLVVDLGCGNARSLIIAAQKFGAKGIGVEISPFYYVLAKINVLIQGESKNIKINYGNLRNYRENIKVADVVFLYLYDKIVYQIESWIFEQTKPHSSIVSLAFPFKNHRTTRIESKPPIYIYKK